MRAVFCVRLWHVLVLAWLCLLPAGVLLAAEKPADPAPPLDIRGYDLAANQDQPVLCFTLSQTVARRPDQPLETFIGVDPAAKLDAVPRNNRLCLTGFSFGGAYTVTLKTGLPGVSSPLAKDAQFRVQVPNRPPEFDFAASGADVLPRLGNDGLPIRSVNVPNIDIDLFRIADADIGKERSRAPLTEADADNFAPRRGDHVWHGTVTPKGAANRDSITYVPVLQAIGGAKPGLYIATARRSGATSNPAEILPTQYFFVSDLGLAAYRGLDTLTIWARSLSTGNPATGAEVALVGRNNRELARSRADDNGFVRFDGDILHGSGGDEPVAIHVYGQSGDLALLDLDADTSASPVNALLYPDRETYQPGQTVHMLALLRNAQGAAIPKQPLTVNVVSPNGVVFDTQTLTDQGGGYDLTVPIPERDAIGTWRIDAYIPGRTDPVGAESFAVVPQGAGLMATVSADAAVLDPSLPANYTVQTQYSDGQAAPNTPGALGVTVAAASLPFPAFPAFSFGLVDEAIAPVATDPLRFTTDASGKAALPVKIAVPPLATRPLEAIVKTRLFDVGGSAVERTTTIPVATQNLILGVRPAPGPVFADQSAHFEVIAVSPDGARQEKPGAGWEILRQDFAPAWQWNGTRFISRPIAKDAHVAGGMLDIPGNTPAVLDTKLPAGRYRIEVFDPTGEAISSAHFMVGWGPAGLGDQPDMVTVRPANPTYRAGENAELFVKPPYDADVALIAADPRIRGAVVQHVPAGGAAMHIDMPQDGGAAMQLLATAIAPADAAAPNLTRRAFSAVSLPADPADRQLDVKMDVPTSATPQSVLTIPLSATGAADQAVFVRVVATDGDGPDAGDASPLAGLIAKNAEAVSVQDNYGRLITASGLSNNSLRLPTADVPVRPHDAEPTPAGRPSTTISSEIVALDKNGAGKVSLTLPDFSGTLKITATAWSTNRTGQASATLPVRFPLAVDLTLPPWLAPEDRADLTLALDNVDGPRGEYRIKPRAEGAVTLADQSELVANLAEHERRTLPLTVLAKEPGIGTIVLSATGPNGIAFERRLSLDVRPAAPPVIRHAQTTLKPGATLAPDAALAAGLRPEGLDVSFIAGVGMDFDLAGLARDLTSGDFLSADRIIAAAQVYLAPPAVIKTLKLPGDAPSELTRAARSLAVYQTADGGFGRWRADATDPWLSASAADFLTRARAAGATVPDAMFDPLLAYLGRRVAALTGTTAGQTGVSQSALAEAAYSVKVLAANGKFDLFQLRYFHDRFQSDIHDPVTAGLIAAAFAVLGDKPAATVEFAQAMAQPVDAGAAGGLLSDLDSQAILTGLAIESGAVAQPLVASSLAKLSAIAGNHRQLAPSEAAWLFRIAAPLPPSEGSVRVKAGDEMLSGDHAQPGKANTVPAVKNQGDKPIRLALTVSGAPAQGDVKDQGFELQRSFFDTAGKPVDPATVRQNDILVVVLSGRFTGQGAVHPVIIDPLPSGWRIEAADIADPGNRYPWLKELGGTSHAQADAGRYVAVPNLTGERHEFKVAYVVRAAVRGQFAMPGTVIEDTAQPGQSARGAAGRTKIDPAS